MLSDSTHRNDERMVIHDGNTTHGVAFQGGVKSSQKRFSRGTTTLARDLKHNKPSVVALSASNYLHFEDGGIGTEGNMKGVVTNALPPRAGLSHWRCGVVQERGHKSRNNVNKWPPIILLTVIRGLVQSPLAPPHKSGTAPASHHPTLLV